MPIIDYQTSLTIEKIGSVPLHIEAIKDLDHALNKLCEKFDPKTPEEEEKLFQLCPYFGVVWPSARGLATFMTERKKQFNKKRGIEVGCGLAIPSIIASKIGAQMLATDFHPDVGPWLQKNAELNQVKIEYQLWDWCGDFTTHEAEFDFVLASDVLYEKQHPESLVQSLSRLIKKSGSIYLSDPGRAYLKQALAEFEKLGFRSEEFIYEVEESSSRPEHRLEKKRKISVFEFARATP